MGQQTRRVCRVVREKFGYTDFRPGQEAALKAILAGQGQDTLAVMPTGQGKSLIYQVGLFFLLVALSQESEKSM